MEETLIRLGLEVYKVAGIIGILIFFIAILIFLLITFYARRVSAQSDEIKLIREEAKAMQERLTEQLREALRSCELVCERKDLIINELRERVSELSREVATLKNNERWFKNELFNMVKENDTQEID